MPDSSGADSLTYTSTSGELITIDASSNRNYFAPYVVDSCGNNIYTINASITSFTNTYSLLGGGGYGASYNGGHGLLIDASYTVTTVTNLGVLLGGGGGGTGGGASYGGAGGGGGGGDSGGDGSSPNQGNGGSIVKSITAGSGSLNGGGTPTSTTSSAGGGGPSGNGGNASFTRTFPYVPIIDASGGLGGGTYVTTGYGSPGGNGPLGGNAGTNSYNFTYGGGAGANINNIIAGGYGGGGGGYGCGSGGAGNNSGGGGGGGGGYGFVSQLNTGGNGGYSIYNQGTIQTLINAQGGPRQTITDLSANLFPYGPLFYGTTATNATGLTNYKTVIKSTNTTSYGQLWNTGWGTLTGSGIGPSGELLVNFAIDTSYSAFPTVTPTHISYYQVLVNVKPSNSTYGTVNGLYWYLQKGTPVTIGQGYGSVTYNSYDLVVSTAYSGADNLSYVPTVGISITTDASANANYYARYPIPTTNRQADSGYSIYTIDASINSFTNTYSLLGGGGGANSNGISPTLGGNGGHGLQINNTSILINTVTNLGVLLGGGGGGTGTSASSGGAGGGGGAGGNYNISSLTNIATGGSIILDASAGSGSINGAPQTTTSGLGGNTSSGGGGPSGNGGNIYTTDASGVPFTGYGGFGGQNYSPWGSPGGRPQVLTTTGQQGSQANAGTNSYTFKYGGGGGVEFDNSVAAILASAGGGYGCGSGGGNEPGANGGGGGGGGGGRGFNNSSTGTVEVGKGGYSIYNQGTISTLINAQGGPTNQITSGSPFYYGPLFYGTTNVTGLTNYKTVIKPTNTTSYGQLWNTGWGTLTSGTGTGPSGELLVNFGVDTSYSILPTTPLITPVTYYQVLVNVKPTSSTYAGILNSNLGWYLKTGIPVTILGNTTNSQIPSYTYNSYDLVLNKTYPGADNLIYFSTSGELITTNTTASTNYFGPYVVDSCGNNIYTIDASINSFTNTYSLLGGGGAGGAGATAGKQGGHGLLINTNCIVIEVTNLGALLGGGGGGAYIGSYGGAGGGGGASAFAFNSGLGGSIILDASSAGSGSLTGGSIGIFPGTNQPSTTGGGGPSGDGGTITNNGTIYSGGLGGGTYASTNYGSPGGNANGGNAGTNSYNFRYGGGAGTICNNAGGGGGGYGCGAGGAGNPAGGDYGAGGGGGGGYGGSGAVTGGNGGYSIYNQGTIQRLTNAQGGPTNQLTDGSAFPYGPLFYGTTNATGLTNYKMIIKSASSYGQLWNTGWGATVGTGPSGELIINEFTPELSNYTIPYGTTTYYQVLVNVIPNLPLGKSGFLGSPKIIWQLQQGTPVTIGTNTSPYSTTYNSYNLVITNTPQSNGFLFNTFFL